MMNMVDFMIIYHQFIQLILIIELVMILHHLLIFDRYGIRIPSVMVSPWIAKNTLAFKPDLNVNTPQYSHSSVVHTLREQYASECPPFTKRDSYSLTFENILNLDSVRNDYPKTLPPIPSSLKDYQKIQSWFTRGKQKTNDWDRSLVSSACGICDYPLDKIDDILIDQDTTGNFLLNCIDSFLHKSKYKSKHV